MNATTPSHDEYVDSLLCGLATLEAYQGKNAEDLDSLVLTTNPAELVESLLRVAGVFNTILAAGQGTTANEYIGQFRHRLVTGRADSQRDAGRDDTP